MTDDLPISIDGVRSHRWDYGELGATRRRLGVACGAKRLGLALIEIDPGKRSTPPHTTLTRTKRSWLSRAEA
jgi:uncharacterized cupin superfamily protein